MEPDAAVQASRSARGGVPVWLACALVLALGVAVGVIVMQRQIRANQLLPAANEANATAAPAPSPADDAADVALLPAPDAQPIKIENLPVVEPNAPPSSLEEVVSGAMPAVVLIETSVARGSGFFAAPDMVITNAHVVGNLATVTLRFADGLVRPARRAPILNRRGPGDRPADDYRGPGRS